MREEQKRRIWLGAGGVALAAAGAAGTSLQRRHMRRIEADPEQSVLSSAPSGRPLGVRCADGTMLHAEVFGADDGATLVLAHGWTEMLSYWTYVINALGGEGFRIVAYDLRGHGQSEPAAGGDYAMERFGEDLEAVLEACVPDGRRAVVAGHSLGAMSVAAWAERHDAAGRVYAAALLNTGVGDLIAQQLLFPVPALAQAVNRTVAVHGFLGARTPLPHVSTPASHAAIRHIAFGPDASPAQVAFYERMLWACPPDARARIGIAMSEMDLYDALAHLTVPTLVIAGEKDRLTPPSHAQRIAQMLPDLARLIVLPETGHMAPLERPTEVSAAVAELAELAGRSSGDGRVAAQSLGSGPVGE
jgi:pimeloyl-ACP methyl ester carboxylesterase